MKSKAILLLSVISLFCGCSDIKSVKSDSNLTVKATYPSYDDFTSVTGGFAVNLDITYNGKADLATIYMEAYKNGVLSQKMTSVGGHGGSDKPSPVNLKTYLHILDSKNSPFKLQADPKYGDEFYVISESSKTRNARFSVKRFFKRDIFESNLSRSSGTFDHHDLTQKHIPIFYIIGREGCAQASFTKDGMLDFKSDSDYLVFYLKLFNKEQKNGEPIN